MDIKTDAVSTPMGWTNATSGYMGHSLGDQSTYLGGLLKSREPQQSLIQVSTQDSVGIPYHFSYLVTLQTLYFSQHSV
jgi:hypothetical protein